MSKYQVDKAMREVVLSPEQSAAFNRDPASFLARFDLSEEERTAIDDAAEFLRGELGDDGQRYSAAELIKAGQKNGINDRTLRRAR